MNFTLGKDNQKFYKSQWVHTGAIEELRQSHPEDQALLSAKSLEPCTQQDLIPSGLSLSHSTSPIN